MPDIPPGFCQCGCGERTSLATKTNLRRGAVRGEPQRYRQGHGTHPTKPDSTRARRRTISEAARERNRMLQVERDRRKRERAAVQRAQQERRARRSAFEAEAAPFVSLYRREKAKRRKRVDRLIAEAKAELARQDAERLPRRGGRPRKVVTHG